MHCFQKFIVVLFPTTLPLYKQDMEISCESAGESLEISLLFLAVFK